MTATLENPLLDLAAKIEAASGRDREIDLAIDCVARPNEWSATVKETLNPGYPLEYLDDEELPPYSSSVDAALSLVPEGWRMAALCARSPWFARLETLDFKSVTWGKGGDYITDITAGSEASSSAATPALALCAASLRALANQEKNDG